jgi:hypothetical protein
MAEFTQKSLARQGMRQRWRLGGIIQHPILYEGRRLQAGKAVLTSPFIVDKIH